MFEKIGSSVEGSDDAVITEENEDNLGNNPEYTPLDETAVDTSQTPDQVLMEKEEDVRDTKAEPVLNDENPSNWESDAEEGKYDNQKTYPQKVDIETNPTHTTSRNNIAGIEEMKGREKKERFWEDREREENNSKKKGDKIKKDSIRFDDAV